MRTSEKVLWFVIGGCIGAGVALLYAPQAGKTTRRLIRRKAEETKDSLLEAGENAYEAGRDIYRKGIGLATGAAEGASNLFTRVRERAADR